MCVCVGAAALMRCAYLEDESARAEAVLVVLRHDHTLCKVSGDLRLDGGHHLELGAAAAARAPKDGELLRVALWCHERMAKEEQQSTDTKRARAQKDEKVARERKQVEGYQTQEEESMCHRRPAMEIALRYALRQCPVRWWRGRSPRLVRRSTLRGWYDGCERGLVCRRRARGGIATGHRVVPMSGYVIDLWSSRPQMWKRGLERPARCAKRLEVGACGSWCHRTDEPHDDVREEE